MDITARIADALDESFDKNKGAWRGDKGRFSSLKSKGGAKWHPHTPELLKERAAALGGKLKPVGTGGAFTLAFESHEKALTARTALMSEGWRVEQHNIPGVLYIQGRVDEAVTTTDEPHFESAILTAALPSGSPLASDQFKALAVHHGATSITDDGVQHVAKFPHEPASPYRPMIKAYRLSRDLTAKIPGMLLKPKLNFTHAVSEGLDESHTRYLSFRYPYATRDLPTMEEYALIDKAHESWKSHALGTAAMHGGEFHYRSGGEHEATFPDADKAKAFSAEMVKHPHTNELYSHTDEVREDAGWKKAGWTHATGSVFPNLYSRTSTPKDVDAAVKSFPGHWYKGIKVEHDHEDGVSRIHAPDHVRTALRDHLNNKLADGTNVSHREGSPVSSDGHRGPHLEIQHRGEYRFDGNAHETEPIAHTAVKAVKRASGKMLRGISTITMRLANAVGESTLDERGVADYLHGHPVTIAPRPIGGGFHIRAPTAAHAAAAATSLKKKGFKVSVPQHHPTGASGDTTHAFVATLPRLGEALVDRIDDALDEMYGEREDDDQDAAEARAQRESMTGDDAVYVIRTGGNITVLGGAEGDAAAAEEDSEVLAIYVGGEEILGDEDEDDPREYEHGVHERHTRASRGHNGMARKGLARGMISRRKNARASARSRRRRGSIYAAKKAAKKLLHNPDSK